MDQQPTRTPYRIYLEVYIGFALAHACGLRADETVANTIQKHYNPAVLDEVFATALAVGHVRQGQFPVTEGQFNMRNGRRAVRNAQGNEHCVSMDALVAEYAALPPEHLEMHRTAVNLAAINALATATPGA